MSIVDIAMEAGFSSQSYFTQSYRRFAARLISERRILYAHQLPLNSDMSIVDIRHGGGLFQPVLFHYPELSPPFRLHTEPRRKGRMPGQNN